MAQKIKCLPHKTDLGSKPRNRGKSQAWRYALHSPALGEMESGARWPAGLTQPAKSVPDSQKSKLNSTRGTTPHEVDL